MFLIGGLQDQLGSTYSPLGQQHYSPTTLWPVTAAPGGGYQIVQSNTSSPISLPGVQGNIEGTFKYLSNHSPLGTPFALGVQTGVTNQLLQNVQLSTPPLSPGSFIQLRPISNVPSSNSFALQNNFNTDKRSSSSRSDKYDRQKQKSSNNISLPRTDQQYSDGNVHSSDENHRHRHRRSSRRSHEKDKSKSSDQNVQPSYNKQQSDDNFQQSSMTLYPDRGLGGNPTTSQHQNNNQTNYQSNDQMRHTQDQMRHPQDQRNQPSDQMRQDKINHPSDQMRHPQDQKNHPQDQMRHLQDQNNQHSDQIRHQQDQRRHGSADQMKHSSSEQTMQQPNNASGPNEISSIRSNATSTT